MRLKKENYLSSDTQLVNGSPRIQTEIQLVHAIDRNKIVMKSKNWPKEISEMSVSTLGGF